MKKFIVEEEFKEVTKCPCGEQTEEVEYSEDMIPTIKIQWSN